MRAEEGCGVAGLGVEKDRGDEEREAGRHGGGWVAGSVGGLVAVLLLLLLLAAGLSQP